MRTIPEFEGGYSITTDGRVWSEVRKDSIGRPIGGHWMKPRADKDGYLCVNLCVGGRGKVRTRKIHRLVADTYLTRPEWAECVNHKDGDILNNTVSNLEWTTFQGNTQHAWDNGLCKPYDRSLPYNRQGIIDANKRRTKCVESKRVAERV